MDVMIIDRWERRFCFQTFVALLLPAIVPGVPRTTVVLLLLAVRRPVVLVSSGVGVRRECLLGRLGGLGARCCALSGSRGCALGLETVIGRAGLRAVGLGRGRGAGGVAEEVVETLLGSIRLRKRSCADGLRSLLARGLGCALVRVAVAAAANAE